MPEASDPLAALCQVLVEGKGILTVRGHTDAFSYEPGIFGNNWSLSATCAKAARTALMRGLIPEERFRRIEGLTDRKLLSPADPRKSITLPN